MMNSVINLTLTILVYNEGDNIGHSNKIKRLRRTLRAKRRYLHIYKCKVCGGSLRDSKHLDVCNDCYKEDNFCLLCGRKIESGGMFCIQCKNEKKPTVKRRMNLKKLNKNKVRVLKLVSGA